MAGAGETIDDSATPDEVKCIRPQNELGEQVKKLFVFVLYPEVEAANNCRERQARPEAMARMAARTNETERGTKRRGIVMSVLASLSKRLKRSTPDSLLSEIACWLEAGCSVFRAELDELHRATSVSSRAAS